MAHARFPDSQNLPAVILLEFVDSPPCSGLFFSGFSDYSLLRKNSITALFNNMRTLKFKSQPTNAFFATVNQMFGGSSKLPTTAERAVIKSNRRVQFRQHSRKLGGAAEHLIDGSEKRICRLSFQF